MPATSARLVGACVALALAAAARAGEVSCSDPLASKELSEAVDAALMELLGEQGWMHSLRTRTGYEHALEVYSCTPDGSKWEYPPADTAVGLLRRVLDSGELKVAGVQWSQPGAADYKTDPEAPTGFWPEYLSHVAAKLSAAYGTTIRVKRTYYANSNLVVAAVADGTEDMSEPYYYLSGFFSNSPRIESMHFSCVTVGTASMFFTKDDSGVSTMDGLYSKIEAGPNRLVGFIGQGNYDTVSSSLPASTVPNIITNSTEIEMLVRSGNLVAGYMSEGEPSDTSGLNVFMSGLISPRVALFRQDSPVCTAAGGSDDSDGVGVTGVAVIVILAVVALLLAGAVVLLVAKERQGSPLFSPLLMQEGARGAGI